MFKSTKNFVRLEHRHEMPMRMRKRLGCTTAHIVSSRKLIFADHTLNELTDPQRHGFEITVVFSKLCSMQEINFTFELTEHCNARIKKKKIRVVKRPYRVKLKATMHTIKDVISRHCLGLFGTKNLNVRRLRCTISEYLIPRQSANYRCHEQDAGQLSLFFNSFNQVSQ